MYLTRDHIEYLQTTFAGEAAVLQAYLLRPRSKGLEHMDGDVRIAVLCDESLPKKEEGRMP